MIGFTAAHERRRVEWLLIQLRRIRGSLIRHRSASQRSATIMWTTRAYRADAIAFSISFFIVSSRHDRRLRRVTA
jgi:hypothetical protein